MAEFIYSMHRVSRHYPPDRDVLREISLSFFYGAKIGVIGPNGSGKSSLLRIMAGREEGYTGEARLEEGYTVGMLEQEPRLDEAKDVLGNVVDGVEQTKALLDEYQAGLASKRATALGCSSRNRDSMSRRTFLATSWMG